jgi:hypothetical protein
MPPLQGFDPGGYAHPGLRPGLVYLAPSGLRSGWVRSPRATPWAGISRPFRASIRVGTLTQGYALGWYISPLRGFDPGGYAHPGLRPGLVYLAPSGLRPTCRTCTLQASAANLSTPSVTCTRQRSPEVGLCGPQWSSAPLRYSRTCRASPSSVPSQFITAVADRGIGACCE